MNVRLLLSVIALLLLGGCAGKQLAPGEAQERRVQAEHSAFAVKREPARGGLADYLDKPEVRVARLGARWGLRLGRIADPAHRGWVVRDLAELEALRRKYELPPPAKSRLFVAGPGLYAVLVLPPAFSTRGPRRIDLHLWDYGGHQRPASAALSARPGGKLSPVGEVVRAGARLDHAYLMTAPRPGPLLVELVLARAGKVVLARNVQSAATDRAAERP